MENLTVPMLTCLRCDHQWVPRQRQVWCCPRCHSPKWQVPKETPAQKLQRRRLSRRLAVQAARERQAKGE